MAINLGSTAIGQVYWGSDEIVQVYHGSTLILDNSDPGAQASNPVISSATFTAPTGGNPAIIDIGASYGGADSLELAISLGNETIIVDEAQAFAQSGGTNTIPGAFIVVSPYTIGDPVDVSGLSVGAEAADAAVIFLREISNGGTSGPFTALTGISGIDQTAPLFSSAEVGSIDADTVRVTFDSAMYGSTASGDWSLTGNTISSVSFTPGNAFADLTLGTTATSGDDYTGDLAYSGTGLTDIAGNALAAFSGQDVTNNVGGGSGFATASDLWETGSIASTEVTQSMDIGAANASREVLFLVGMEGDNSKPAGFDFTVNSTSYEGGAEELGSQFTSNACAIAFNVPVATGTTATIGLTHGSSGSSTANTVIAIPHTGSVVSGGVATDYEIGLPLSGSVTTSAGGSLHILLFGRDESFDNGTITITDPSGATLETTIVSANDIASGEHPSNTNSGRAYVKLEGTSAGTTTINLSTTASAPSRWTMIAVALDS